MWDSSDLRAHAATWRAAASLTRGRAERVLALAGLRWESSAAEVFRDRIGQGAAGLRRLGDLQDEVAAELVRLADVVERVVVDGGSGTPW